MVPILQVIIDRPRNDLEDFEALIMLHAWVHLDDCGLTV